ncbi:TPA: hypothetical protein ACUKRV_005013 [Escherichia coli]
MNHMVNRKERSTGKESDFSFPVFRKESIKERLALDHLSDERVREILAEIESDKLSVV